MFKFVLGLALVLGIATVSEARGFGNVCAVRSNVVTTQAVVATPVVTQQIVAVPAATVQVVQPAIVQTQAIVAQPVVVQNVHAVRNVRQVQSVRTRTVTRIR